MPELNIPRTAARIARALNPLLPEGSTLTADSDGTIFLTDPEGKNPIVFSDMVTLNQVRNGHDQRTAVEISARNVLDQIRELILTDKRSLQWPTGRSGYVVAHASFDDDNLILSYGSEEDVGRVELRVALNDLI